jgi:hypothetical protein
VNVPAKTRDLTVTSTTDSPFPPVVRFGAAIITPTVGEAIGGFRSRTRVAQTTLLGPVWIGIHLMMMGLALGPALLDHRDGVLVKLLDLSQKGHFRETGDTDSSVRGDTRHIPYRHARVP